ncbi:MAG: hypothetical protein C0592_05860 [Marinilabiliales bacterium]|nr:MAG: hypothetical protein C0592_05860 [Marinilabiliales bacterium]
MKLIQFAFAIITGVIVFNACTTDFDINGDYKETTVVYGILDPTEQYQYIRINRAFLGEGNALQFAQIPDSSNYPYILDVIIQGINSSGQVVSTSLSTDTIWVYKESDVFYSGYQPIYRIKMPFVKMELNDSVFLDDAYTYKLRIVNPITGNVIESTTPVINAFTIDKPIYNYLNPRINFGPDASANIEWESPVNGKRFEVKFIFTYYELYDSNPTDTITKTMTWNVGTITSSDLFGGEEMLMSYNNHDFYYLLGAQLEERNDVERRPGIVELNVTVGTDELNTYININNTSSSIIQERPQFTNISNGMGIFTSRFEISRTYKLNSTAVDTLMFGQYTKNLSFEQYWNN